MSLTLFTISSTITEHVYVIHVEIRLQILVVFPNSALTSRSSHTYYSSYSLSFSSSLSFLLRPSFLGLEIEGAFLALFLQVFIFVLTTSTRTVVVVDIHIFISIFYFFFDQLTSMILHPLALLSEVLHLRTLLGLLAS